MGRLIAVLGDIHANIEALDTVLADCRANGVTEYLCTGDVVGYNASPRECLARIRELGCPVVKGNHDHYVSTLQNLDDFNPNAAAVVQWTAEQLSADELEWLRSLPYTAVVKGVTVVHSTMDNPENFGYVFDYDEAKASFINQMTQICFHGHTHCPIVFERRHDGIERFDDSEERILALGRKYFINVGSVGQPRDGDPRATYMLYDPQQRRAVYRRLPYDIESAARKIRAAGLPERLAQRLFAGE